MTPRRRLTAIWIVRGTGRESRVAIAAGSLGEAERLAGELVLDMRSIELDAVSEEARFEDRMTAPAAEAPSWGPTSGSGPKPRTPCPSRPRPGTPPPLKVRASRLSGPWGFESLSAH